MGPRKTKKKEAENKVPGAKSLLSATFEELFDARQHAMDAVEDFEHALLLPHRIVSHQVHGEMDDGIEDDYEGGSVAVERLKRSLKRSFEKGMQEADAEALGDAAGKAAQLIARILAPDDLGEATEAGSAFDPNKISAQDIFSRALSRGVDKKIIKAAKDRFEITIRDGQDPS